MDARTTQSSNQPGATITIRAVLTEYGLPVESRAVVYVDLERPDHTHTVLAAREVEPGIFEAGAVAMISGVYKFRVRGSGATFRGKPFTREQLLTGAVWKGGDNPPTTGGTDAHRRDEQICRLIECLFRSPHFERMLAKNDLDAKELEKCLRVFCGERIGRPMEGPARERGLVARGDTQSAVDPRAGGGGRARKE
jgi:hypothetical protein